MNTKVIGALAIALAIMTWLYLGKRDDLASAIEQANTVKALAVVEAQKQVSEVLTRNHSEELARRSQLQTESESALRDAREAAELANVGIADRERQIRTLELEASIDEIPDSGECLNVYVPSGLLHARDCGETGLGGDGEGGACINTGRTDQTAAGFSSVTFSELVSLTNKNIVTIDVLNGQLKTIDDLNNR